METNQQIQITPTTSLGVSKEKKYIAVTGAKGVVALGMDYKIRDVHKQQGFQKKLDEVIKTIWNVYCGADPTMLTDEFVNEASESIIKKFSMLGVNEIKEAFRLASINVISSDLRSFGGRISIQVIGKTLDNYLEYRKPIAAEILTEQREQQRIQDEVSDIESRRDYQKAVTDFWIQETMPKSWIDCPAYFLETLEEMNLVTLEQEKRHEFYRKAKAYRIEELERQKNKASTLEDIRNANSQLFNIDGEKGVIINYAKSMYLFELKTKICNSQ